MDTNAVPTSAQLALVEQYPPSELRTFEALKASVHARKNMVARDGNQYLSLRRVSTDQFMRIERRRAELGAVKFTHFPDIEILIIKVPSPYHETAHAELGVMTATESRDVGMARRECVPLAATLYQGPSGSRKEGDSSYTNLNQRIGPVAGGWPCLVIEAGVSESLARLRADANWWMGNSLGQVNIVLVIWIQPRIRRIQIEKYIPHQPPPRASPRRPQPCGAALTTTTIDAAQTPPVVTGAPLRLGFADVFDRPPNQASERNIVFGVADLQEYAEIVLN